MTVSEVVLPPLDADPRARAAYAVAAQHQAQQAQIRKEIVVGVLGAWATMNLTNLVNSWFGGVLETIFGLVSLGQETVAAQAGQFVTQALAVQGVPVDVPIIEPLRFAGISSDGRDLESLLTGAVAHTFTRLNRGDSPEVAAKAGANFLTLAVSTQISDAGRAADQVAITSAEALDLRFELADPTEETPPSTRKLRYGWVRMLTPPSCSRCVVLAGQFYKWNEGFKRHPMCDCRHIPAVEDIGNELTTDPKAYFNSLTKEEQDYYFGVANSRAIRDGADLIQVVNASTRKGALFTADDGRRYTREGTTRRGLAGQRAGARRGGRVLRPTPWQIYKDARGDRAAAVRLLRSWGYIL